MSCRACGQPLGEQNETCSNCDHTIFDVGNVPAPVMESVEEGEPLELQLEQSYVGKKHPYYRKKWDKLENRTLKISWNGAAFFLGPVWLGYRKMYKHIAYLAGIYLWLDLLLYFIDFSYSLFYIPIILLLKVSITLIYGLFGNFFYWQHTNRQLAKGKLKITDHEQMSRWTKKKGRTSWISTMPSLICLLLFYYVSQNALIPPNAVNIISVQNGTFKYYPSETIGYGFHKFFGSPHWENNETEHSYDIVRFTGVANRDGEVVPIIIDIGITEDSFIDQMIMVDGKVLNKVERHQLLNTIFPNE